MTTGKQVPCIPDEQPVKVAFSQDGEYMAVVSKGNTASISKWKEIDSRTVMLTHGQNTVQIQDIAFSPLGDYVATASKDGSVKLWEFPSGNARRNLLHEGQVESVAFSPDGKLLTAGSLNGVILVWEVSTGKIVKRLAHTRADCSANH
jgi:WD40 repeat protein